MQTVQALPHWDMEIVFPGLDSPEFQRAFQQLVGAIDHLQSLFDAHTVDLRTVSQVDADDVLTFDTVVEALNQIVTDSTLIWSYVYSFVTTDSRDSEAQARFSELQQQSVRLAQLEVRFTAWIGSIDVDTVLAESTLAREHQYLLRRSQIEAQHLMSPPEESLAAEMQVTGGAAWARLHGNITSQLMVDVEGHGEERVPMSVARAMAMDPDRNVRRRAYEAELRAWDAVAVPIAAALNSIKGQSNTLAERRGWDSPLEAAVFGNGIDRQTLDAMLSAAQESFPEFRRYMHAKARLLGVERLAWYDIFAPAGQTTSAWTYEDATRFVVDQFGAFSSKMSAFAERAFGENWIDVEPRPGKRDGAFCMPVRRDESRILSNFAPSYDGMSTLAHELGHAYHNLNLAHRTMLQRDTPMALAETASIFCQTIVEHGALERADASEQLVILEASLQDRCQVVVDITSRFLFESNVYEGRRERELSVEEFKHLMLQSQRDTYGDGLDESALHPFMWAVKGHYYGSAFYNFPYMFGLLFGLGLYAEYQREPEAFRSNYDELLSSTGTSDAATLARRFGIDIHSTDFWRASLDVVKRDIDRFEQLVDACTQREGR